MGDQNSGLPTLSNPFIFAPFVPLCGHSNCGI
jgi:urea transporter